MRRAAIFLGVLIGCGATTPPTTTSPTPGPSAAPPTPPASASASASASAGAPAGSGSAGGPAASASASARQTDVLLDTKLPPKVVSVGGGYSVGVNDPKGFSRTEVVGFVEKSTKAIDGCFAEIFKAGGKKGKLSFAAVVDAGGKLKSVKLQDDELKDKKLPGCIEKVLKKVEWGKPTDKAGATFVIEWAVQS